MKVYYRVQGWGRLRPCREAPQYDQLQLQLGDTLHLLSCALEDGVAVQKGSGLRQCGRCCTGITL